MRHFLAYPFVLTIVCGLVGCSESVKLINVSGKVLIDGELLPAGTIRFVPEQGRPVSSAILEDGSFQLRSSSISKQGGVNSVLPGKYRVVVSASKIIGGEEGGDESIEWFAPSHYSDLNTSGLEVELLHSQEDLLIELTWEGAEDSVDSEENSQVTNSSSESSLLNEQELQPAHTEEQ